MFLLHHKTKLSSQNSTSIGSVQTVLSEIQTTNDSTYTSRLAI